MAKKTYVEECYAANYVSCSLKKPASKQSIEKYDELIRFIRNLS